MIKKTILSIVLGLSCVLTLADAALLERVDVQRYIDEQVGSGKFSRPELKHFLPMLNISRILFLLWISQNLQTLVSVQNQ